MAEHPSWDAAVVRAQPSRTGRRWAYIIDRPGWWPYISRARYRTPGAAIKAGRDDVAQSIALIEAGVLTDAD